MAKRLFLSLLLMTTVLRAQMAFEDGTYVRLSTGKVAVSQGQKNALKYGVYHLTGQQLMDWGVMEQGDPVTELAIRQCIEGPLDVVNGVEKSGQDFNVRYAVFNNETANPSLLSASTVYAFYVAPLFGSHFDTALHRTVYEEHPYSAEEHLLVSGGNKHNDVLPIISAVDDTLADRTLDAHQTWVYDSAMYNLVGTGRRWAGELFDFTTSRSYDFVARRGVGSTAPSVGTLVQVRVQGWARASASGTKLKVHYGGQTAEVSFPAAGTSSIANYVAEKTVIAEFVSDGSTELVVEYDKNGTNSAAMWLDQIVVDWTSEPAPNFNPNAWYINDVARGTGHYSRFEAHGVPSGEVCIMELDGHQAVAQFEPTVASAVNGLQNVIWGSHEDQTRSYYVVSSDPSTSQSLVFVEAVDRGSEIRFEDLFGVESIVVAPDSLMAEAAELASLQESTGLKAAAISLSYIYDHMNAGTPDVTALRKFLVKAYADYGDVRYLTLFGDASYDYRGILRGPKSNLVPTFESYASFSLYSSFITDDFFGYLEVGEATNWYSEDLDIGIGRIPARNKAEAQESVQKIRTYLQDVNRFGPWRTKAVLVADDVDESWEKEFAIFQDLLARDLDTSRPELNAVKIYTDAFAQESKPGSQRYPEAREKLFREVEQGALVVSYVGHGGEVGWATERVLQLEDINRWTNSASGMPIFTTITCEFTRFDDPNRQSAGEQLFLNSVGGAAALFSTTRSVFATTSTYELNELLNNNLMSLEVPRLGDVLRTTKNSNNSGDKIKFSLIGDPTMPLARPQHRIVLDSINGQSWSTFTDTLNALDWVQIKGSVLHANSASILSDFQGQLWITIFDKKRDQQTLRNDNEGGVVTFKTQNDAVFKGIASVLNGQFTVEFRVPRDINLSVGEARVGTYAASTIEDAWGGNSDLLLGGLSDGITTDHSGPLVRLFMEDSTFRSGEIVAQDADGFALLEDESGINAVGLGIGHNLELILDGQSINVNDYYESNLDDFTRGQIRYPFYNLSEGEHSLELRAWDVLNQWGYDSISFVVTSADVPLLNNLLAYPNPFTDRVNFVLNHNQSGVEGALTIEVMDNSGAVLWRRTEPVNWSSATVELPAFTMSELAGSQPGSGFYHVRVHWTRSADGKSDLIQEKLVYIR
ncbi:MAG: hypothetical protein RL754_35 [Bacteroidota bacterium]